MLRWLVRRLLVVAPLLLGIVLVTFVLIRTGDANPAVLIAGPEADAEQIRAVEEQLHLDEPILVQFGYYLRSLVTGDLGVSWVSNRPVTTEIAERLPATLELVVIGMFLSVVVGTAIGFVSALRHNKATDHVARVVTLGGISMPIFWVGLLLIFVFAFQLGWVPSPIGRLSLLDTPPEDVTGFLLVDSLLAGQFDIFKSALWHLVLPVCTIVVVAGSTIAKQARSSLLEVLGTDAIRYGRAQGLSNTRIRLMALQLGLPTIITFSALTFGFVLGGSALVETIFSWGGLGQAGIGAVTDVDFALVQGYVLTLAVVSVLVYLVADILVSLIDKRTVLR